MLKSWTKAPTTNGLTFRTRPWARVAALTITARPTIAPVEAPLLSNGIPQGLANHLAQFTRNKETSPTIAIVNRTLTAPLNIAMTDNAKPFSSRTLEDTAT